MNNKFWLCYLLLNMSLFSYADQLPSSIKQLDNSQQLLLVITQNESAVTGLLYLYQRADLRSVWKREGSIFPVVVGKNGMLSTIGKREGDGRTPMGIFALGPIFGFAQRDSAYFPYYRLTVDSVCVDDPQSHYYNKLINSNAIDQPDWHSAEHMRSVPQYRLGAVLQYNVQKPIPGAGSCVFLHSWRNSKQGTTGCVALSATALQFVLWQLDSKKRPIIALFTQSAYRAVQVRFPDRLPKL